MLGVMLPEAMAYAKPLIASVVGGIPGVARDGETGLLVPEKDPERLAEAIARVLTDNELAERLGKRATHSFMDTDLDDAGEPGRHRLIARVQVPGAPEDQRLGDLLL